YGLLHGSEKGNAYINNPAPIDMALDKAFAKISEDDFDNAQIEAVFDEDLYKLLKDLTKKVGKQKNLPPYVIFQDPSLEDMATKYPISLEELEHIVGVGKNKAMKFGKPFVEVIAKYVEE